MLTTRLSPNAVAFSDSGVLPSTTYFYRVKATNSRGMSGYSNVASATTRSQAIHAQDDVGRVLSGTGGSATVGGSYTQATLATNCTLYAAANGNDKNNGSTPTTPKTLTGASTASSPGSVICLMGGTYNVATTFSPAHNGTSNAWIVYKAYGDSTPTFVWTAGTDYNFFGMENYTTAT